MPNWTTEQEKAIFAHGGNILVSAAAGSGKTAVLVERVIKKITSKENPVDVDKLLIVTFTNAAAAEMKSRLTESLTNLLSKEPDNINLQRQITLVPNSKICTIDSFCINFVRDNFFNLGIEQDFNILDETELQVIENNALDEVLENFYKEKSPEFVSLCESLSSVKSDKNFCDSIKRIHNYINSQPFPFVWLNEVIDYYNPNNEMKDSNWYKTVVTEANLRVDFCISLINDAIDNLADDELFDKNIEMLNADLIIANDIKNIIDNKEELDKYLQNLKFSTLPRKSQLKSRRNVYKDILTSSISPLICVSEEEFKNDNSYLYPQMKCFEKIITEFHNSALNAKKERNAYSFSDIEHFALELLVTNENGEIKRSELAKTMSDEFEEILIDEYQDTNNAQNMLFEKLSNDNNMFTVGDVKQSIYRFRLAVPQIFMAKKESFADYTDNDGTFSAKIILDKNFRSREGICTYANFLFSNIMSKKVGEIDYDEQEFLNFSADFNKEESPTVQIKISNIKLSSKELDEYEALQIANLINQKISNKEQIKDKDVYRDIKFSDFAILMRSSSNHIATYSKVLTNMGIPVQLVNPLGLFENKEIAFLINLLRVIDNPTDDIALLSVMMCPVFSFTPDELAQIKNGRYSKNLFTLVNIFESEKAKDFVKTISQFRRISSTTTVAYLVRKLLDELSVFSIFSAICDADSVKANVLKFIELVNNYDNSNTKGLTAFIRYLDRIIDSDKKIESATINTLNSNSVKIMSVHKSKGLEFPIVILAGAARKYNKLDKQGTMLLDSRFGIGVKVYDKENICQYKTLPYTAISTNIENAMMSENLRVLYVAVTRAKEQFIPFITENIDSKIIRLSSQIINGKINSYAVKNASSDADLLLLTSLLHPCCANLRTKYQIELDFQPTKSNVVVDFLDDPTACEVIEEDCVDVDDKLIDDIKNKLSYKYKYSSLANCEAKKNASKLDELIEGFDFFAKSRPAFLNQRGLTPSERGTAMHSFMEYCDYEKSRDNLENEINRLVENGFISSIEGESLDRDKLNQLFTSDFAKRLFNSSKVYREFKISSFVKASELYEIDSDEKILVQGIADCVFEENEKLFIVDYKTDKVKSENQLFERYTNQLKFYQNAVSKTLQLDVQSVYLYSFELGQAFELK